MIRQQRKIRISVGCEKKCINKTISKKEAILRKKVFDLKKFL